MSGGLGNLQAGGELRILSAFVYSVWIMFVGQMARTVDFPVLMPACQFLVLVVFGALGGVSEPAVAATGLVHAGRS